ncbi:hypothetical protein SKAU_G00259360 [Synaphobranchus kaupii]|uniref:Ig-like domain-containing protein n=1 Tax=Synaphobranchus kaupii TaxID=118154 RepID=A0A9Q1F4I6_SYNKA|nr:hypothetical protein SKAU_G00259360 [Synaphobranchus kaupii]
MGSVTSISHSINVSVLDPVECRTEVSLPEKRLLDAPVSSSITLSCTVRYVYEPRPAVTWCKQQRESCIPVETGEKRVLWRQSDPNTGVCSLTFFNVSLSDSGEYLCEVHPRKPCRGDTIFSRTLQLYVTRTDRDALVTALDIGRVIFFITATVAIILLTALKLTEKLSPRDTPSLRPPHHPECQQSEMEKEAEDALADSGRLDREDCV